MPRAKIPVQELGGQRGEGAYFRRGLISGEYDTQTTISALCYNYK